MSLVDLLVCPRCRGALFARQPERLACAICDSVYPLIDGVPILLADPDRAFVAHEGELGVRPGYSPWKERAVLRSLPDSAIALDFGAGRQALDDPCIIRMDLVFHPYVDVVADVHQLPFADDVFDFAFGGAVVEHLARPWEAAQELYRVVKPGGYVYADCCFIFPYHGYPHHYFNASMYGLRELFSKFTQLELGVGPFHGSPYALRSVLGSYLECFRPKHQLEREFARLLHRVLWHPLEAFDARIDPSDRFRVAAGSHFLGVKQPRGDERLIPEAIWKPYQESPSLQQRFPQPLNLGLPDNLLTWARTQIGTDAAITQYFSSVQSFDKRGRCPAAGREALAALPLELMTEPEPLSDAALKSARLYFSRPLADRFREGLERDGLMGIPKVIARSVLRAIHRMTHAYRPRVATRAESPYSLAPRHDGEDTSV